MEAREVMQDYIHVLAEAAAEEGGRAYDVGGSVRDALLGRETTDRDIEVSGLTKERLEAVLARVFPPEAVKREGEAFGIYHLPDLIPGYDLQIALPRLEKRTGPGHKDFEITVAPDLTAAEAAARRDFTINAMRRDILTGEIEDPYGGKEDLEKDILRAVDPARFAEDPLRILRAAGFAARFKLNPNEELLRAGKEADLSTLSRERVEAELRKGLLSDEPSRFFHTLRDMEQEEPWFHEIKLLRGVPQDPSYHPEGDVYIHTMIAIDRAAALREESDNPWYLLFLALTHDFGKVVKTFEKDGRIHAYGHEEALDLAMDFVRRITNDDALERYLRNMIPLHMRPNRAARANSRYSKTNRLFDEALNPKDLLFFSAADRPVSYTEEEFERDAFFLEERLHRYEALDRNERISGKDLREAGIPEGPHYQRLLEMAQKLWCAETKKSVALRQVLKEARKLLKEAGDDSA